MQDRPPHRFSVNSDVRIPGEFEPQESLVFGCDQLVRFYPQTFVDFVTLLHERVSLYGIIDAAAIRLGEILLATAGLPKDAVSFLPVKTSSVWIRDFSPIAAEDRRGHRVFLKFRHNHMKNRDDIGTFDALSRNFKAQGREVPIFMEGGNLISNGAGLSISSKTIISQNAQMMDHQGIAKVLDTKCGVSQWACATPINGERTGHIDMIATFLREDTLAVAQCDPREDPNNRAILDDFAKAFEGFQCSGGKMNVVRVPMPYSGTSHYRSYNNAIFANGLLLVPNYPGVDPKLDRRVLAMFSEWLPGVEVRGIDCEELSLKGGSLHCMTRNINPSVVSKPVSPVAGTEQARKTLSR